MNRDISLRLLKYFDALATDLNYRKASERLFISQPALSAAIRQLENHVGDRLFDRDTHSVALTVVGREWLPHVRRALREVDAAFDAVETLVGSDRIRIGYLTGMGADLLFEMLDGVEQELPDLAIETTEYDFADPSVGLASGASDIALLRPPVDVADLEIGRGQQGVLGGLPSPDPPLRRPRGAAHQRAPRRAHRRRPADGRWLAGLLDGDRRPRRQASDHRRGGGQLRGRDDHGGPRCRDQLHHVVAAASVRAAGHHVRADRRPPGAATSPWRGGATGCPPGDASWSSTCSAACRGPAGRRLDRDARHNLRLPADNSSVLPVGERCPVHCSTTSAAEPRVSATGDPMTEQMSSLSEDLAPPPRVVGEDEDARLAEFGYEQRLDRSVGRIASFAIGFSTISATTAVFTGFGAGYLNAGSPFVWTLFLAVPVFLLWTLVAADMAAKIPLAGYAYQWTSRLNGSTFGWFTGCAALVGWVSGMTSLGYIFAGYLGSVMGWELTQPKQILTAVGVVAVCVPHQRLPGAPGHPDQQHRRRPRARDHPRGHARRRDRRLRDRRRRPADQLAVPGRPRRTVAPRRTSWPGSPPRWDRSSVSSASRPSPTSPRRPSPPARSSRARCSTRSPRPA